MDDATILAAARAQLHAAQEMAEAATSALSAGWNSSEVGAEAGQARISATALTSIAHSLAATLQLVVFALERDQP